MKVSSLFNSIKSMLLSQFNKPADKPLVNSEYEKLLTRFETSEFDDLWLSIKKSTKSQLNQIFDFSKIQNHIYSSTDILLQTAKPSQPQQDITKSHSVISEDLIILSPFLAVAEPLLSFANFMKQQIKQKYEFQVIEKVNIIEQSVEILSEVIDEFVDELVHVGLKNLKKHFQRCLQEQRLIEYFTEADVVLNCNVIVQQMEAFMSRLLKQGDNKDLILYNEHKRKLSFLYFRKQPASERIIPFFDNPASCPNNQPFKYADMEESEDDQWNEIFSFNSLSFTMANPKYTIQQSKKVYLQIIHIFTGDIFESKFFTDKFFEKKIEIKETQFIESKYQPSLHSITEMQEEDTVVESAKQKKKAGSLNFHFTHKLNSQKKNCQFSDEDSEECNNSSDQEQNSIDLAQNTTAGSSQITNQQKTLQLMQMIQQLHNSTPQQKHSIDCASSHSSSRYQVEKDEQLHLKKAQFSSFLRRICQEIIEIFHSLNFQNYLVYQSNLNFLKIKNRLRLLGETNTVQQKKAKADGDNSNCLQSNKKMLCQLCKIAVNLFLDENARMKQRAQYEYYLQNDNGSQAHLRIGDDEQRQNLFKKTLILDEYLKAQMISQAFNDMSYIFFEKDKHQYEPWLTNFDSEQQLL